MFLKKQSIIFLYRIHSMDNDTTDTLGITFRGIFNIDMDLHYTIHGPCNIEVKNERNKNYK